MARGPLYLVVCAPSPPTNEPLNPTHRRRAAGNSSLRRPADTGGASGQHRSRRRRLRCRVLLVPPPGPSPPPLPYGQVQELLRQRRRV